MSTSKFQKPNRWACDPVMLSHSIIIHQSTSHHHHILWWNSENGGEKWKKRREKQDATKATQHTAKINRYFSTNREGKKRIKNSRGALLFFPERKRKKKSSVDDPYRTIMAPKVPSRRSHCAVDICVSSLSCSNEKTNDRSIAAQTINVCAVHCSFVLFSFPGKKNRKKSNCNQNT